MGEIKEWGKLIGWSEYKYPIRGGWKLPLDPERGRKANSFVADINLLATLVGPICLAVLKQDLINGRI